jgi:hypothetical protein
MTAPAPHGPSTPPAIRPVGAWVVSGFLVIAVVVIWVLVAAIFHARS